MIKLEVIRKTWMACKRDRRIAASYGIFAATSLLFAFIIIAFPRSCDDYWFLREIFIEGPEATGSDSIFAWLKHSFIGRYNFDNARIGNFLAETMLIFPRWLPMSLTCIAFAAGYGLAIRYSGLSLTNWPAIALLSFLLTFAPLWQDSMFCQMFAFNYIWSLPLLFWALNTFLSPEPKSIVECFFIGLLCAIWHESNAAIIAGCSSAVLLFHRTMARKDRFAMILGAVFACVWFASSPAWSFRDTSLVRGFHPARLIYLWAFGFFVGLWLICLLCKRMRPICLKPESLIMLTAGIGLGAVLLYSDSPRSAMPSMFLVSASIPWMMLEMYRRRPLKNFKRWSMLFATILCIATATHLCAVCIRTVEIHKQFDYIEDTLRNNAPSVRHNAIFAPVTYCWESSPLTLLRPDRQMFFNNHCSVFFIGCYFLGHPIHIVPVELKDYRHGLGTPIAGSDSTEIYKGHLVSPVLADTVYEGSFVHYGNRQEYTGITHTVFTGTDGRDYDYIQPKRSLMSSFLGAPTFFKTDRNSASPAPRQPSVN